MRVVRPGSQGSGREVDHARRTGARVRTFALVPTAAMRPSSTSTAGAWLRRVAVWTLPLTSSRSIAQPGAAAEAGAAGRASSGEI